MQYTTTREELDEAANKVFEMASSGKVKVKISKKYSLKDIAQAAQDCGQTLAQTACHGSIVCLELSLDEGASEGVLLGCLGSPLSCSRRRPPGVRSRRICPLRAFSIFWQDGREEACTVQKGYKES